MSTQAWTLGIRDYHDPVGRDLWRYAGDDVAVPAVFTLLAYWAALGVVVVTVEYLVRRKKGRLEPPVVRLNALHSFLIRLALLAAMVPLIRSIVTTASISNQVNDVRAWELTTQDSANAFIDELLDAQNVLFGQNGSTTVAFLERYNETLFDAALGGFHDIHTARCDGYAETAMHHGINRLASRFVHSIICHAQEIVDIVDRADIHHYIDESLVVSVLYGRITLLITLLTVFVAGVMVATPYMARTAGSDLKTVNVPILQTMTRRSFFRLVHSALVAGVLVVAFCTTCLWFVSADVANKGVGATILADAPIPEEADIHDSAEYFLVCSASIRDKVEGSPIVRTATLGLDIASASMTSLISDLYTAACVGEGSCQDQPETTVQGALTAIVRTLRGPPVFQPGPFGALEDDAAFLYPFQCTTGTKPHMDVLESDVQDVAAQYRQMSLIFYMVAALLFSRLVFS